MLLIAGFVSSGYTIVMPEHELNVANIIDKMHAYRRLHRTYPATWFELGEPIFCGTEDEAQRPEKNVGAVWHPQSCRYRYHIKSSKNRFVIRAVDTDGKLAAEINERTTLNMFYLDQSARKTRPLPTAR